jgi:hypothetical protein
MKSPHSEDTSSSAAHSENLQRELSALIAHIQSDRKRVDDPRFCSLLDKSAEILKGLRTLFERFGPDRGGEGEQSSRPAAKKAEAATRARPPKSKSEEKNRKRAAVVQPQKRGKTMRPAAAKPAAKREDPAAAAARVQLQRKEARAPKMPRGPSAPKPAPPESGKPIWRMPHSS